LICTKCDNKVDDHRYHLGYKECIECSDTEKYSAHVVYPHKTGAFVQPVSLWDRWLKDYQVGKFQPKKLPSPKGKPLKNKSKPYRLVVWGCINYYMDNGYFPALDYLKELYKDDKITMMTKTRIVNDITNLQALPTKIRKKVLKK